jgi:tetraacyldisaccharide 4'-kinase
MAVYERYMQDLRRRVESIARERYPVSGHFLLKSALLALSFLYGGGMRIRSRLYASGLLPSKTLPCRVVSIGNIVAGGTGKTPMTMMAAQLLKDLGYRVVVVSRGYRGNMEEEGGIVSDGSTVFKGPEEGGDEPYLMASLLKGIPVLVGRRRYRTGLLAVEAFKPDVVILDDAFQHLGLKRDLDLVLLDSRSPFGNGHLLPRGLLREPLSALKRAHAVIFTRSENMVPPSIIAKLPKRLPLFHTVHESIIRKINQKGNPAILNTANGLAMLAGKKALAFAGLADNGQFFDSLVQAGCLLKDKIAFGDHHHYERDDLVRIARAAEQAGAELLITTFKDLVKLEHDYDWPTPLVVIDVTIRLAGERQRFINLLCGS